MIIHNIRTEQDCLCQAISFGTPDPNYHDHEFMEYSLGEEILTTDNVEFIKAVKSCFTVAKAFPISIGETCQ